MIMAHFSPSPGLQERSILHHLSASDGNPIRHFEACGQDGTFHPASARIIGRHPISVSSPKVAEPRHTRYAWSPYPDPPVNLINDAGLPASPFSTERAETLFRRPRAGDPHASNTDTRPNILLIVGEDHGCELSCYGDHGAQMARGKVTVYEGGTRVPYLVRWPGVSKAKHRSNALVSTIDLLPTFMDAAGIQSPDGLPGRSIRSVLSGSDDKKFREYLACERNCDAARHTFPRRPIRDARYKLIHSPVRDREDPAARYDRSHGAAHWSGCLTDEELAGASEQTKAGYARWLEPPEYQLNDLKTDPHEWLDLSNEPGHTAVRRRLEAALQQWQAATHDPLADPEKLRMLLEENMAVFKAGQRSPKDGWQYVKYLAPAE
jgi:hypothetical protein